ncbi:MAG: DUF2911 domain-containing protein [Acidobacteria bacterium]|nr:DUF2911 domain-containing protein [Acidobacteriota bacterium]
MPKKLLTISLAAIALTLVAQEAKKKAPLSPAAETSAMIGGKAVSIKYASPSMRGRKIFGGLVPYGQVWRAGANSATALHTEANLTIGDLKVPAGDYTIYVWPEEKEWQLVINKQTGQWGTVYNASNDLGRTKMKLEKASAPIESYKMTLSAASLRLEWENTIATVPVRAQ